MKQTVKQMSVHYRIMELFGNKKPLNTQFDEIMELISKYDLLRTCRKREIVYRRHLFIWYLCNNTKITLSEIGRLLGKDHATILHAKKTVDNFIKFKDKVFSSIVFDIDSELRNIYNVTPNI